MKDTLLNFRDFFLKQDLHEKKNHSTFYNFFFFFIFLLLSGCCTQLRIPVPLPPEADVILGDYIKSTILNDPLNYPILDRLTNQEIYNYANDLTDTIFKSLLINNKDNFNWEVRIIKKDSEVNAFACPGGYLFIYTGLLKFMKSEDEFAGVLGHEMAHADLRHITKRLIKILGIELISKIIRGEASPSEIEQVAKTLIYLKFSRCYEQESDYYSVKYLCSRTYNAAGAASLFERMLDFPSPPEFLSSHPSYSNRIRDINNARTDLGCIGTETYTTRYQYKIALLP